MIRDLLDILGFVAIVGFIVILGGFLFVIIIGEGYLHAVHSDEREKVCYDLGLVSGEHTVDCFDLSPKEVRMLKVENEKGGPALTSGLIELRGGVLTYKRLGDTK